MSELRRVSGPSSPLEGRSGKAIAVVAVAILIAIAKPWGGSTPGPPVQAGAPTASASVAPAPSIGGIANYDPYVFGLYEPTPAWELWPAGFLVSFGFATRIEDMATAAQAPTLPPTGSAAPSAPTASAAPSPDSTPTTPAPGGAEPVWPARITISSGSHLALLGINTPLGYDVALVTLWRRDATGGLTRVPLVRPPSPWPVHFTIVAIDDGNGRDPMVSWPPGEYVLGMRFVPGTIEREIEIVIDGSASDGETPAPVSSAAAAGS